MEASGTTETSPGSVLVFRSGEKVQVIQRYTTAVKYLRNAVKEDAEEPVHFDRADGTGRVFIGHAEAAHVVVEELK